MPSGLFVLLKIKPLPVQIGRGFLMKRVAVRDADDETEKSGGEHSYGREIVRRILT